MINHRNFFLLFLFSINIVLYCYGQTSLTGLRHYGIEDGLSHNQVLSVHKDTKGMIWVLAHDKLNRFDGKDFSGVYQNRIFNPAARIIGEDQTGDLWIKNAYEKYEPIFFDLAQQTFKSFNQKFQDTPLQDYEGIEFYFIGNSGHYFFGTTSNELLRYDPIDKKLQIIPFDANTRVLPFYEDSEGVIWVNNISNTSRYEGSSRVTGVNKRGKIVHEFYINQIVFNLNAIDDNQFSFTSHDDLYIVNRDRKLKKYPLSEFGNRPKIEEDAILFHQVKYDPIEKQYWFFNESRELSIFHPEKGILFRQVDNLAPLDLEQINDLFTDSNGSLWLSTLDGLYVIDYASNDFKRLLYVAPNEKEEKERYSCRKMTTMPNGDLYVNTLQGLFQIKNIPTKTTSKKEETLQLIDRGSSLLANEIDSKNRFWTTSSKGIHRYSNNQIEKTWAKAPGYVWSMYEGESKFWLGSQQNRKTKEQLCYIDLKTDERHVFNQNNGFEDLGKSIIYAIQKTRDGTLWLVTDKGLFILDEAKGIKAQFSTKGKGPFYFPVDELKHLHEDEKGLIWLATSHGLLRWDRQQHTFQQYTDTEGLSHNNLHAVYEDDFGFLWMSSDYGLNQFQKSTGKIKNYLPSDGITHHEFNRISHHQVRCAEDTEQNGMIYFGGLNGLIVFHPKDFVARFDKPVDIPLVLLKSEIFRKGTNKIEDLRLDATEEKNIVINPGDQSLYLEFILLDYSNTKGILYEHRIKGTNEKWTSRKDNSLLISGLNYGDHELIIRAKTSNGVYSKQGLHITIQVLRPFYLQWWFGMLCLGILGIVVFGGYKRRTNQLIEQKNRLEAEVQVRTKTIAEQASELRHLDKIKSRFFANVSHELRTPLTLVLGPLEAVLKRNEIQPEDAKLIATANHNAKNLLKLTNEILDLTKIEVSKVELVESSVFILQEARRIFSSFETQAYQKGILFQFVNEINPDLQVQLDTNKFEKVINNLLSNALKFTTREGKVTFILEQIDQTIRIQIQDTGKGISPTDMPYVFERFYQSKEKNAPTEGGTGIGLALCLELAKLFEGQIWAESELGQGSTFYFEIPLKEVKQPTGFIEEVRHIVENSDSNVIAKTQFGPHSIADKKEIINGDLPSILIVEDNVELRNFLKMILQKKYAILCAENGEEAWTLLQKNRQIDLILSDLMMPIMDGFQLLEKVKSTPDLASIPVVMLTARAELQDRLKALRIGVDDYILKPFQEEELLIRIQNLLKNASSRMVYEKETIIDGVEAALQEDASTGLTNEDHQWLANLEEEVLNQISNFDFNSVVLAQRIFLSRRQLDRRLKTLTGLTIGEYIREARLQQARRLIETRDFHSIKEICSRVGIKSPSYFSKQFKIRFGKSATELLKR